MCPEFAVAGVGVGVFGDILKAIVITTSNSAG